MAAKTAQEVRIIGGKWRGRKLRFEGDHTLRPTLGRTRETLFNWLRPSIHQLRCLDLFAGSGVLGLEAISQGAAHCTFVDSNRRTIHALTQNIANLEAANSTEVLKHDAVKFLTHESPKFDLVFVDPPYAQHGLFEQVLDLLSAAAITPEYLFVEASRTYDTTTITERFPQALAKTTTAGDTQALLLHTPSDGVAKTDCA